MSLSLGRRFWVRLIPVVCVLLLLALVFSAAESAAGIPAEWLPRALVDCALRNHYCGFREGLRGYAAASRRRQSEERLKEQVRFVTRDDRGLTLWTTPRGQFWIPDEGPEALVHVLTEQAVRIYGDGARRVQKGDVVLDCGAHVGGFVREALDAGAGLVVAIEPVPTKVTCLQRSFAPEMAAGRVIIYPKGVWDKEDRLTLKEHPEHSGGDTFVLNVGTGTSTLPLTTIDRLIEELKLTRVDFIKMDIEGAEQRALMGAAHTLSRFRPRLALAVYHQPDDRERIPDLVRQAWPGYHAECGTCSLGPTGLLPNVMHFF